MKIAITVILVSIVIISYLISIQTFFSRYASRRHARRFFFIVGSLALIIFLFLKRQFKI
jgi:hypothetical protein